ncbi:MAG: hypothetical protein LBR15_09545 [Methanobrevibacter sp.]|jgi:hypothetical protein|nr:hypothetical protein [Candidatus Methanovirga australis]
MPILPILEKYAVFLAKSTFLFVVLKDCFLSFLDLNLTYLLIPLKKHILIPLKKHIESCLGLFYFVAKLYYQHPLENDYISFNRVS